MSESGVVRWSGVSFPLSEFVSRHGNALPAVIIADNGYSGPDDVHSASAGEVSLFGRISI